MTLPSWANLPSQVSMAPFAQIADYLNTFPMIAQGSGQPDYRVIPEVATILNSLGLENRLPEYIGIFNPSQPWLTSGGEFNTLPEGAQFWKDILRGAENIAAGSPENVVLQSAYLQQYAVTTPRSLLPVLDEPAAASNSIETMLTGNLGGGGQNWLTLAVLAAGALFLISGMKK